GDLLAAEPLAEERRDREEEDDHHDREEDPVVEEERELAALEGDDVAAPLQVGETVDDERERDHGKEAEVDEEVVPDVGAREAVHARDETRTREEGAEDRHEEG